MININIKACTHKVTNTPSVMLTLDRDGNELCVLNYTRDELGDLVQELVRAMQAAEAMAETAPDEWQ